ncbi:MAG: hypothetical protein Q4E77_00815, partial [Conchiformibius sp.]|nr:hypothetical protein [Conchiformibius sp.]
DNEQRQELAQNLNKGMAESVNDTILKFLESDYNNILASIKENLKQLEEMLSRDIFNSQLYIFLNQTMVFTSSLVRRASDRSDARLAVRLESLVESIRNHMAHANYDGALKLIKQAISEIDEKL